jgi:adenine C2-methylase RlmN of 23S rRNA A2503 and tRNA A37
MIEQEYFTVHYGLTVNIEPLDGEPCLPSIERFESEIPTTFIVASEFSQLDQLNDSARQELKSSDFKHVIQLLDTQNSKLNLLLSFMLSQQDEPQFRHKTISFGASQLSFMTTQPIAINAYVRAKIFLEHPPAAIYCYGKVVDNIAEEQQNRITIKYELLRDVDQDLLIRAALYQQQKLLRQRSLDRDK